MVQLAGRGIGGEVAGHPITIFVDVTRDVRRQRGRSVTIGDDRWAMTTTDE